MPRATRKRLTGRTMNTARPVSQVRRTSAASPVSPTASMPAGNSSLQAAEALGGLSSTLRSFLGYSEAKRKEVTAQGSAKAMAGQELTPEEQQDYRLVAGHEAIKGKEGVQEYRRGLLDIYTETAGNLDAFRAKADAFEKTFIAGRSDDYIKTFYNSALNVRNAVENKAHTAQVAAVENELSGKVGNLAQEFLFSSLGGVTGEAGLDQIYSDPEAYSELISSIKESDFTKQLRDKLEATQKDFKGMLSRGKVSESFWTVVDSVARKYGLPELADVAFLQDKDGQTPASGALQELALRTKAAAAGTRSAQLKAFGAAADKADAAAWRKITRGWQLEDRKHILSEREYTEFTRAEKREKARIKAAYEKRLNDIYSFLADTSEEIIPGTLQWDALYDTSADALDEMRNVLPPSTYREYRDILSTMKEGAFATTDDQNAWLELNGQALSGSLSMESVSAAVRAGQITRGTAGTLLTRLAEANASAEPGAPSYSQERNGRLRNFSKYSKETESGFLIPSGPEFTNLARARYAERVDNEVWPNWKNMSVSERSAAVNKIAIEVEREFDEKLKWQESIQKHVSGAKGKIKAARDEYLKGDSGKLGDLSDAELIDELKRRREAASTRSK